MSVFWHEENYCIVVTQSEKEKKRYAQVDICNKKVNN